MLWNLLCSAAGRGKGGDKAAWGWNERQKADAIISFIGAGYSAADFDIKGPFDNLLRRMLEVHVGDGPAHCVPSSGG